MKKTKTKTRTKRWCRDYRAAYRQKYYQEHKAEEAKRQKKYQQTIEGKAVAAKGRKKYQRSDKGKAVAAKYYQEHKIEAVEYQRKYRQTLKGYLRNCFGSMKQRCNNLKNKSYKNYGGRGIRCLFKSSQEFVDYVVNELKVDPRGLQIDRIDNDGHYEPGNIRFVTCKVNNNNRRDNK